ncbi:bacteriohemerythrin [Methanolobus bombayensis]|uniref:bacteriohemerythrin n=1 Tax=Methanolobus bombayensis TaxID=38023 RepID=UPI001AE70B46|nr:bacteriohemerythrin [Methanolobus bombayensis]MBP1907915.1 hemerythrin [Methanolobus bombayensis]
MALITWSDKYSIQIKEIDDQHKVLVGMINDLHDAMKNAKSKEVSMDIINKMAEYTKFHFSTEEKYMKRFAYQDYEQHKMEHEKFVEKVLAFKKDYENGKAGISYEILNFLKDWLVGHIQGTDKKYASLFIEKGVK